MKLELLTYEKENLPRGWKPYYIYLIMVDHIEVGRIVLREGSNEERYYDGHIGYTIEKEYRGHHYSKDACLLLFDKAKEKGFKQLMITCSPDNIASRKIIYQNNLLDIQIDLLNQVMNYMVQKKIDTLVIAGDVYDRAIASKESIVALNHFLEAMILHYHKKVLIISGNHDSSERLDFASSLLQSQGLYIVSYPEKEIRPIEIEGVYFYLVPFFKPSYIRYLYEKDDLKTYQDAFAYYLSQQTFVEDHPKVLVTHQFIAGNKEVIRSESEVILSVGGSEIIDVDLCKDFDYVALGHIHASQKIKYDYVRYAGSLMKYSFDEVHQKKGMVEVTIDETGVSTQIIPLKPQKDLVKVVGKYEDVLHYPNNENDFVAVELLDKQVIGHAYDFLKEKYPYLLQITYQSLEKLKTNQTASSLDVEKQSPIEIFKEFYEKMKGEAMSQESEEIIQQLLEEVNEDDAH